MDNLWVKEEQDQRSLTPGLMAMIDPEVDLSNTTSEISTPPVKPGTDYEEDDDGNFPFVLGAPSCSSERFFASKSLLVPRKLTEKEHTYRAAAVLPRTQTEDASLLTMMSGSLLHFKTAAVTPPANNKRKYSNACQEECNGEPKTLNPYFGPPVPHLCLKRRDTSFRVFGNASYDNNALGRRALDLEAMECAPPPPRLSPIYTSPPEANMQRNQLAMEVAALSNPFRDNNRGSPLPSLQGLSDESGSSSSSSASDDNNHDLFSPRSSTLLPRVVGCPRLPKRPSAARHLFLPDF